MKITKLFLGTILIASNAFSQIPNYDISGGFGGTNNDISYTICHNPLGDAIFAGRFEGTVNYDPFNGGAGFSATSNGGQDIFILRSSPGGGPLQWQLQMGGTGNDYATACTNYALNGTYIVGRFENSVFFNPGPGAQTLNSSGAADVFVLKLNDQGEVLWVRSVGGPADDIATDVEVDASGNIIVAGYFQGVADFDPGVGTASHSSVSLTSPDAFVFKLDPNGNYLWSKTVGSNSFDYCSSVAIDNSNNVILGGKFSSTCDFDPGAGTVNQTSAGVNDAFVLKLNSNGDYQWVKTVGAGSYEYVTSLDVDASNNIISTGYFSSTVDFDPGTGTANLSASGGQGVFVWKLDASGNYDWAKSFSNSLNNQGSTIKLSSSDEIFVSGKFAGTIDFDPGAGTANLTSSGGTDNFFLQLTASGDYLYASSYGASGDDTPRDMSIFASGSDESIWLTGNFSGSGDYDPTAGINTLTSQGLNDGYLISFNYCLASSLIPDITNLSDITSECSVNPTIPPTATNDCGALYGGTPDVSFPITTQGTTVITWSYDDGHGNSVTQTQNVIINDVTDPVPNIASLPTINEECSYSPTSIPTATDNCAGTLMGTADVTFPITTQGTTVVSWTYDDGHGNSATQTQNVVINDVTGPIPDASSLPDLSDECSVSAPSSPTATDNCSGLITGTPDVTFPIAKQGVTTVNWTFQDGNGNTSTQTQNVIISDVTDPVADVPSLTDYT